MSVMKCPKCNKVGKNYVTAIKHYDDADKRRRRCECGYRWNTIEYISISSLSGKVRK